MTSVASTDHKKWASPGDTVINPRPTTLEGFNPSLYDWSKVKIEVRVQRVETNRNRYDGVATTYVNTKGSLKLAADLKFQIQTNYTYKTRGEVIDALIDIATERIKEFKRDVEATVVHYINLED